MGSDLPANEKAFYNHLKYFFPEFVDIKFLVKDIEALKFAGLSRHADEINEFNKFLNLFIFFFSNLKKIENINILEYIFYKKRLKKLVHSTKQE